MYLFIYILYIIFIYLFYFIFFTICPCQKHILYCLQFSIYVSLSSRVTYCHTVLSPRLCTCIIISLEMKLVFPPSTQYVVVRST